MFATQGFGCGGLATQGFGADWHSARIWGAIIYIAPERVTEFIALTRETIFEAKKRVTIFLVK